MQKTDNISTLTSFSQFLDSHGLNYTSNGFYWEVGKPSNTQQWILQITVIQPQLMDMLSRTIPYLVRNGLAFKIVKDFGTAEQLMEGSLGYENLGNVLAIEPGRFRPVSDLAKDLIEMTKAFRGPSIPGSRHLAGVVYTKYTSLTPHIYVDAQGNAGTYVYDKYGNPVPDDSTIPFIMPKNIAWPFSEIVNSQPAKPKKILNHAFYPIKTIKPDSKGSVIIAVYFKKLWQVKKCIIKAGYHDMLADDHGRDVQSRLEWQYKLYQVFKNDVPMPEVFAYFKEGDTAYLAMQYIDGITLTNYIHLKLANRCWRHISAKKKFTLLEVLIKILHAIEKIHAHGYYHRDITTENFLIDKKKNIFLIDMELAWDAKTRYPNPAFKLGTEGHMSPEQRSLKIPTVKDDIFGIGATMIVFFVGIASTKINQQSVQNIQSSLQFFIGEADIATMIAHCFHKSPDQRPALPEIVKTLQQYQEKITLDPNRSVSDIDSPSSEVIRTAIQSGINGLIHMKLLNKEGLWFSLPMAKEEQIGNTQQSVTTYAGLHTGVAGPLYALAKAKKAGFEIDREIFDKNYTYLLQQLKYIHNTAPGLLHGAAGMALAISEAMEAKLIPQTENEVALLKNCFSNQSNKLDLAEGIAGQGIALMKVRKTLNNAWIDPILQSYVARIMETQLSDGSWPLYKENKKGDIYVGLENGVCGVCWFLLEYHQVNPNPQVANAVRKALGWLMESNPKSKKKHYCTNSTSSLTTNAFNPMKGIGGAAFVFATAYKLLGDEKYLDELNEMEKKLPEYPVAVEAGLGEGLTGQGLLYLEIYKLLKSDNWLQKADWIASTMLHSRKELNLNAATWQASFEPTITADLATGASGVMAFLIQYLKTISQNQNSNS